MNERWSAIKRENGAIEVSGFPGVTLVLMGEEADSLGYVLAEANNTVVALTEDERELKKLGILGAGIYDTFYSVQDAMD